MYVQHYTSQISQLIHGNDLVFNKDLLSIISQR